MSARTVATEFPKDANALRLASPATRGGRLSFREAAPEDHSRAGSHQSRS